MNEPDWPVEPTAQTIAAPGLVATALSPSKLAGFGLATTLHAVPFQFSVRVCGLVAPAGVKEPTAQTLFAAFDVVTPVRLARWPGDGLGTALHAVPLKCAMAVPWA